MPSAILLPERGVVEVAGPDAEKFLHNILTNSVAGLAPGEARYAALLAPQGKILFDFLVFVAEEDGARRFLLDCPAALADKLAKRLMMYKLRADIAVADRSADFDALAFLGDEAPEAVAIVLARDPRGPLGWRALTAKGAVAATGALADYEAERIAAVVPLGGVDFLYDDAFPHEANMDRLGGVDFKKGCYVGQEVVSRMQHRTTVRKRVTPFRFDGPAPAPGTPIMAGDKEAGVIGSVSGRRGLAMARLDRVEEAKAEGVTLTAGEARVEA